MGPVLSPTSSSPLSAENALSITNTLQPVCTNTVTWEDRPEVLQLRSPFLWPGDFLQGSCVPLEAGKSPGDDSSSHLYLAIRAAVVFPPLAPRHCFQLWDSWLLCLAGNAVQNLPQTLPCGRTSCLGPQHHLGVTHPLPIFSWSQCLVAPPL